jgi:hypothetical protein
MKHADSKGEHENLQLLTKYICTALRTDPPALYTFPSLATQLLVLKRNVLEACAEIFLTSRIAVHTQKVKQRGQ